MPEVGLEQVLARHLTRVKAPDDLRVTAPSACVSQPARSWQWFPVVATASALAAAAVLLVLWVRPPSSEIRSTEPAQIASWLKSRSFDVPLRPAPPSSIRLTSAHVKGSVAEVEYLVAGRYALLTVSPPSSQPPSTAYHVVRSHLVRGQLFTLSCAFPQDAHTACLLCHMGTEVN